MSSPRDPRKGKALRKEGLKGPGTPWKERAMPATTKLDVYPSSIDGKDLSLIRLMYCMLDEFEVESLDPCARDDKVPLAI